MLTSKQRELQELMSEISEELWQAGWHDGTEYTLWGRITDYNKNDLSTDQIHKLKTLHSEIRGWLIFDEDWDCKSEDFTKFVTTEEWLRLYSEGVKL